MLEILQGNESGVPEVIPTREVKGLTLLLESWLPCQTLGNILPHLGNHGSHGKVLTKILVRSINIPRSILNKMEQIRRFC